MTENFEDHGMHIEEVPVEEEAPDSSAFVNFAVQVTEELKASGQDYGKISQQLIDKKIFPGTREYAEAILDTLNIDKGPARNLILSGLMSDAKNRAEEARPGLEEALGKIADHENPDK